MRVVIAYIFVLLIWSTTPLGIQWSTDSLSFLAASSLRMLLAMGLCWVGMLAMRKRMIEQRSDWWPLLAGAAGSFPSMVLVYWSAQYIPSGLMAVIFGLYPFFIGIFSLLILKENIFNYSRVLALIVAVLGLVVIHHEHFSLADKALWGLLGILVSAISFASATVWLKKLGGGIDPFRQLTGSLTLAAPFFVATWAVFDGQIPVDISVKSAGAIAYLVFAGSLLGGITFFYVLKHCSVSTVSLVTLITPLMAIVLGYFLARESLGLSTLIGCAFILLALALYQGLVGQALQCLHVSLGKLGAWQKKFFEVA